MRTNQSTLIIALMTFLNAALFSTAVAAGAERLNISVERAPVAPDGTTAGRPTDFVLTFRDINPRKNGISLHKGATVEVELSDEFTNLTGGGTLVLVQGWPQSPPAPPPAFLWTTEVVGNKAK